MKIVFTDLDGTLLDHDTYSYSAAKKELLWLNKNNIPVVFCTSKTRKEICYWKKQMNNTHPFISENGGGVFIPKDYFSFSFDFDQSFSNLFLIRLGAPFDVLKETMEELESEYDITSFLSMSVSELMRIADLSEEHATLALKREFDIPFVLHDKTREEDVLEKIQKKGLNLTKGGRFYHLVGNNDKGKAVNILYDLFNKKYDTVETVGIGDSANDFSMLQQVDKPYLVMKKNQSFASHSFPHIAGIGPVGWSKVIKKEFNDYYE